MIEINLLPQIWREPDGPNLPRLAAIAVCILIASIGGFYVGKLYLVDIPRTNSSIRAETERQADLKTQVALVQAKDKELADLKARVNGLENLERSRILWSRLLYYFKLAVPEKYCIIKSFHIGPDDGTEAIMENVGKRFKMEISGVTNANSDKECQQILTNFVNNLKDKFVVAIKPPAAPGGPAVPINVPAAGPAVPGGPAAPGAPAADAPADQPKSDLPPGFHQEMRLRFAEPLVRSSKYMHLGAVAGLGPKDKPDQYPILDRALDFTLTVSFALPPAKNATE